MKEEVEEYKGRRVPNLVYWSMFRTDFEEGRTTNLCAIQPRTPIVIEKICKLWGCQECLCHVNNIGNALDYMLAKGHITKARPYSSHYQRN